MKANVFSVDGKKAGEVDLPQQFAEGFRQDLIKRAFHVYESNNRQAYGTDHEAGVRTSAKYMGKRASYGSWANKGMSRIARIRVGSGHMTGTVRLIPQARKGRAAHSPNPEKIWSQKINDKERKLAIRSAIAATASNEIVAERNHVFEEKLPIVMESNFSKLKKAKDVRQALEAIGLQDELSRASKKHIRAGIGKTRGRKYRTRKGPVVIVAEASEISKAAKNIAGVDVVPVNKLNVNILAPGGQAGRLAIWTVDAIKKLGDEKLYM
ncbi:50S ribosomal protein L4 [uncultured archaeon]|nr:50S ribosomal protein L4 [uncultured archaeon]